MSSAAGGLLKNPKFISIAKRLLPLLFYGALIWFIVASLRGTDFSKLEGVDIGWLYLVLASLLGILSRYYGIYVWFFLLRKLGAQGLENNIPQLVYVYSKSWLGRYIPGTAPWILGKIYFASKYGISKKKLAVSSLLEGGLKVAVTMFLGFLLLILDRRFETIPAEAQVVLLLLMLGTFAAMTPFLFNRVVILIYRVIRRKSLEADHLPDGSAILRGALLYAAGTLVNGVSFFFIAKAVYPALQYNDMLFVMGAGSLAQAASMLAIFIPSGIGVREGIQLLLLKAIMPVEFALVITIITRLWSTIIDLVFFAISKVYYQLYTHRHG